MSLKSLRVVLALLVSAAILYFFLDYRQTLPLEWAAFVKIQFLPALVAGSFAIIALWLGVTLLFGRVYCSVVCPLGILQDLIAWFAKRIHPKKNYRFRKGSHLFRYLFVAAALIAFFCGFPVLLSLLEPYSIFARIVSSVVQPVYLLLHNALVAPINALGGSLYLMPVVWSIGITLLSLAFLLLIGGLAWRYGRFYCNTICPVGTCLGLLSRFSLLRVRLGGDCIGCGLCERQCKGECIDSKNRRIDASRCVACFNCLHSCRRGSIWYGSAPYHKDKTVSISQKTSPPASDSATQPSTSVPFSAAPRRSFLMALFVLLYPALASRTSAAVPETLPQGKSRVPYKRNTPIMPPGAKNGKRFHQKCTACHLCVSKCPANIIRPALTEYGLGGFMQPVVRFDHGFCNYDCTICTEVCPNDALQRHRMHEKHLVQIGRVVFLKENCVVDTQQTNCGACAEHCPTGAVKMVPYGDTEGRLTIPEVDPDLCVGCGACEYICPVRPYRAIYIEGCSEQQNAKPAYDPDAKQQEVKVEGFGF